MSELYSKAITPELTEIWLSILSPLSPEELALAVKAYLLDPNNKFFPLPGQIYGIARPEIDPDIEAQTIVDVIFNLLGSCGADTKAIERAESRLCLVGNAYIKSIGGWSKFSSDMQLVDGDISTLKAQIRKGIVNCIERHRHKAKGFEDKNEFKKIQSGLSELGIEFKEMPKD